MSEDQIKPEKKEGSAEALDHINVKVTDGANEVFFKIKRNTPFRKLIDKYCERQGKSKSSLRFLYDGERVTENNTPDELDINDGDTLEVHQEQIGGSYSFSFESKKFSTSEISYVLI